MPGASSGHSSYKVSGGLQVKRFGSQCLSEWCEVEVRANGIFPTLRARHPRGAGQADWEMRPRQTGTRTTFPVLTEIFKDDVDFKFETLTQRFREMAFTSR